MRVMPKTVIDLTAAHDEFEFQAEGASWGNEDGGSSSSGGGVSKGSEGAPRGQHQQDRRAESKAISNKRRLASGDRSHPDIVRLDRLIELTYPDWEADYQAAIAAHTSESDDGAFENALHRLTQRQSAHDGDRSHWRLIKLDALALDLKYPGWKDDWEQVQEWHFDNADSAEADQMFWEVLEGMNEQQALFEEWERSQVELEQEQEQMSEERERERVESSGDEVEVTHSTHVKIHHVNNRSMANLMDESDETGGESDDAVTQEVDVSRGIQHRSHNPFETESDDEPQEREKLDSSATGRDPPPPSIQDADHEHARRRYWAARSEEGQYNVNNPFVEKASSKNEPQEIPPEIVCSYDQPTEEIMMEQQQARSKFISNPIMIAVEANRRSRTPAFDETSTVQETNDDQLRRLGHGDSTEEAYHQHRRSPYKDSDDYDADCEGRSRGGFAAKVSREEHRQPAPREPVEDDQDISQVQYAETLESEFVSGEESVSSDIFSRNDGEGEATDFRAVSRDEAERNGVAAETCPLDIISHDESDPTMHESSEARAESPTADPRPQSAQANFISRAASASPQTAPTTVESKGREAPKEVSSASVDASETRAIQGDIEEYIEPRATIMSPADQHESKSPHKVGSSIGQNEGTGKVFGAGPHTDIVMVAAQVIPDNKNTSNDDDQIDNKLPSEPQAVATKVVSSSISDAEKTSQESPTTSPEKNDDQIEKKVLDSIQGALMDHIQKLDANKSSSPVGTALTLTLPDSQTKTKGSSSSISSPFRCRSRCRSRVRSLSRGSTRPSNDNRNGNSSPRRKKQSEQTAPPLAIQIQNESQDQGGKPALPPRSTSVSNDSRESRRSRLSSGSDFRPPRTILTSNIGHCAVCLVKPKSHIFIPCGHVCACQECSDKCMSSNSACPICRRHADRAYRIWF